MVKRPKLDNVGEDQEIDPANEVDASFNPEGNEVGGFAPGTLDVISGTVEAADVADQEAAGVGDAVADKPTRPANNGGSNNPRTVSPKTQFNNLKSKVLGLGKLHGGGKTSMIALAEAVVEAAQDGAITPEQTSEVYDKFKEGVTKASSYEDAGEVPDEAAMGAAPAKSLEQQLSKLRQFVYLGNKYESDALDLVRKARNMHIELLRVANGSADAKKGVKPGSTYAILVDVARAQLKKQKEAVEAGKKPGATKHVGLAPVLTDDELRALMTQEVIEPVDKTGEDYLLDTLNKAKATYRGSDKRNAITSDELANAIEWLRQALAKAAPDLLSKHDAEEQAAANAKQQAAADKAERERLKAEKAAQPKPTKAERQAALATAQPAA
jgi:hypothetical protein